MDHIKLSAFLSAHVPVAFKIIVKLDYLENKINKKIFKNKHNILSKKE